MNINSSNENKTLTQNEETTQQGSFFENYVSQELEKDPNKEISIAAYFDWVTDEKNPKSRINAFKKEIRTYIIEINNNPTKPDKNKHFKYLKKIRFDKHYKKMIFKICDLDNLEIVVSEAHNAPEFSVDNCKNIDLKFELDKKLDDCIKNEKDSVDISTLSFQNCTFKTIEMKSKINQNDFTFRHRLEFLDCEIEKMEGFNDKEFYNSLIFKNTIFKDKTGFGNCTFEKETRFESCTFEKETKFGNCTFHDKTRFESCTFEKETRFMKCKFKKIDFVVVDFKDNVYFNYSKFNGAFILDGTQFDKAAHFYDVDLNDAFDFSSCVFKEIWLINFSALQVEKDFKKLENIINNVSKKEEEKKYEDPKLAWIEKIRDSLAIIKHNFIEQNNLIEANKYRVIEFYAEELKLKHKCKIEKKKWHHSLCESPKETVDYLQLLFYRHTSNHHSDLLKSFHTILLLIGLFAVFNVIIVMAFNGLAGNFTFDLYDNSKLYKVSINHFITSCPSLYLILINFIIMILFIPSFLGLLYLKNTMNRLVVFFPSFRKAESLKIMIENIIKDIKKNKKNRPAICRAFVFSFLFFVIISYVCSFLLLTISPKSVISVAHLFSGNQHILDPLSALSGIYTVLLVLLIYSLQRTSRKNSIM